MPVTATADLRGANQMNELDRGTGICYPEAVPGESSFVNSTVEVGEPFTKLHFLTVDYDRTMRVVVSRVCRGGHVRWVNGQKPPNSGSN